jgi:hypothetical protein
MKTFTLLTVLFVACALSGCSAIGTTSRNAYNSFAGAEKSFNSDMDKTLDVTLDVLKDADVTLKSRTRTVNTVKVIGKAADGKTVRVYLEEAGDGITTVQVRVGAGHTERARYIISKIDDKLS